MAIAPALELQVRDIAAILQDPRQAGLAGKVISRRGFLNVLGELPIQGTDRHTVLCNSNQKSSPNTSASFGSLNQVRI